LDRYFMDKPYRKGSVWQNGEWHAPNMPADMRLAPLSECEDINDSGSYVDGYFDPSLNILMGNSANTVWDGDRRLNPSEWGTGDLNPFDIDHDNRVELPMATDPRKDNSAKQFATYDSVQGVWKNPYTKAWVLAHTTTHEIIHVLSGGKHSADPACVMYEFSNNWKRADHLSDWYRSLLMIHNEVR